VSITAKVIEKTPSIDWKKAGSVFLSGKIATEAKNGTSQSKNP
jgi:hypothetical protein